MAWQSPSAMGPGGAAGGDGNAQTGTEYTLQGKGCTLHRGLLMLIDVGRGYALPPARVAQPRTGAQCLGH